MCSAGLSEVHALGEAPAARPASCIVFFAAFPCTLYPYAGLKPCCQKSGPLDEQPASSRGDVLFRGSASCSRNCRNLFGFTSVPQIPCVPIVFDWLSAPFAIFQPFLVFSGWNADVANVAILKLIRIAGRHCVYKIYNVVSEGE